MLPFAQPKSIVLGRAFEPSDLKAWAELARIKELIELLEIEKIYFH